MKTCSKCRSAKPESEFPKRVARAGGGLQPWCKACFKEYQREHAKRPSVRAKRNAASNVRMQAKYAADPVQRERAKANAKAHWDRIGKEARARADREGRLRRDYGITGEDFDRMLAAQGGRCGICGKEKKLAVDHCHETGRVRGLLCTGCNSILGKLGDQPDAVRASLERFINYLDGREQHGSR